eukprot:g36849.t1
MAGKIYSVKKLAAAQGPKTSKRQCVVRELSDRGRRGLLALPLLKELSPGPIADRDLELLSQIRTVRSLDLSRSSEIMGTALQSLWQLELEDLKLSLKFCSNDQVLAKLPRCKGPATTARPL